MRTTLFVLLASLWLPAACSSTPAADSADQAALAPSGEIVKEPALGKKLVGEGALLLDVRTQQEWDEGHLDGAEHIPVQQLDARIDEVDDLTGGDKSKPIVVYCRGGKRAQVAKEKLLEAGHSQVVNLGGMSDWPED